MRLILPCITLLALLCGSFGVRAKQPQSLSATVNGAHFAGDDDTILLVPLPGTFTLMAATAGAASYPPLKTPIDRLSITCKGFARGQTLRLDSKDFANSVCNATFQKAAQEAGRDADEYSLDKGSSDSLFEITAAHDSVIEGRFTFPMTNKAGKKLTLTDGHFVAEDRQL